MQIEMHMQSLKSNLSLNYKHIVLLNVKEVLPYSEKCIIAASVNNHILHKCMKKNKALCGAHISEETTCHL